MEIKHLIFFKRAAELEHMTKAAEELSVSQPFLSRSIAELESELGVTLFDHVGRGVVLNPCGKAFYNRVVRMLNGIEDAKRELLELHNSLYSQIKLVTNVSLYMTNLLKEFFDENPDVNIHQLSAPRRRIARMLKEGETDFAICCPPLIEEAEFITEILAFERGVVIYPEGHCFSERDRVVFEDISKERLVSVAVGYATRDAMEDYFRLKKIHGRFALETGDTGSLFNYVEHGLGIAVMPLSIVLQHPKFRDSWVPIYDEALGRVGSNVSLSWRKDLYMSENMKRFAQKCREYFARIDEISNREF